jgi:hypothetical protein
MNQFSEIYNTTGVMNVRSKAKKLFLVELDDDHESEDNTPFFLKANIETSSYHLGDVALMRSRTDTNMSDGHRLDLKNKTPCFLIQK